MALQIREHGWRSKYTGQRFMTVKQIPWIFLHYDIDRIEQSIQASLFNKGRTEIWHNKVTDEHHAVIGKMDKKRIAGFSPLYRNEFDSRSSNLNLCMAGDSCVGFETANVLQIEAAPEEDLAETTGTVEHRRELFSVVFTGKKLQARIETAKVLVPSDMIPVRVGHQNGCQFWQSGSVRP